MIRCGLGGAGIGLDSSDRQINVGRDEIYSFLATEDGLVHHDFRATRGRRRALALRALQLRTFNSI
jgi:hypothetical protein